MTTISRNKAVPYQDYFTAAPQRGNGEVLHRIDEYSLDGSHKMESMNSILEGVSQTSSDRTLTAPDDSDGKSTNDDVKPRRPRDLTALMSQQVREQFVAGQRAPRTTRRERMGSVMSARRRHAQIQAATPLSNRSYRRLVDEYDAEHQTKDPEDDTHHDKFIVWEVIPMDCERKSGRVLFKFSSTNGACFLLKYKYAVQFVQLLMKKTRKAPCGVFYQAFEYHGETSSLLKAEGVSSWLESTIGTMQPPEIDGSGKEIVDNANVIKRPSQMSTVKRIGRYLKRRRLKKLIRRQLAHTHGRVKRSRGRLLFAPFQFVWNVLTGKSRSSL